MFPAVRHTAAIRVGDGDGTPAAVGDALGSRDGDTLGEPRADGSGEGDGSSGPVDGDAEGEGVAPAEHPPRSASVTTPTASRAATVCQLISYASGTPERRPSAGAVGRETRREAGCCALE